jgi:hypothetical protein
MEMGQRWFRLTQQEEEKKKKKRRNETVEERASEEPDVDGVTEGEDTSKTQKATR